MEAWQDELQRLDERVRSFARRAPQTEEAVARPKQRATRHTATRRRRRAAHRAVASRVVAARASPTDSRRDGCRRRTPAQRARAAPTRRARSQRRRSVRRRVSTDREQAASERALCEDQLRVARERLAQRQREEDETRQTRRARRAPRSTTPSASSRSAGPSRVARRSIVNARGTRATSWRSDIEQLGTERAQLADALTRHRPRAGDRRGRRRRGTRRASRIATTRLEEVRATDRETRDREATARAELFRADEVHTSLQGKVNALDALERERVGLAPAAARLLREREQFGDGAMLGPLSDFISADQASALLVERFLGATVHAVLVRDRDVAEAVRSWHNTAHPGPLLLLPLDALRRRQRRASGRALASRRRDRTGPAIGFARSSATRMRWTTVPRSSTRAAPCGCQAASAVPDRCDVAPSCSRCAPSSRSRAARGRKL